MKGKVQFKVGNSTFSLEVEERSDMETLHKLAVLGNPPSYCKELPSGFYSLESNKDSEGNIYVNVVCKGKSSSGEFQVYKAKLGQYKAGGFFWHNFKLDEFAMKRKDGASASETSEDIEI